MKYVLIECPVEECGWHSGDWHADLENEARQEYDNHWRVAHVPMPPEPVIDEWEDDA